MRFLVDENLSPLVAAALQDAGHDAVHVRDIGLLHTADAVILADAAAQCRTVISADTDFGQLLAASGATAPSVILLRREKDRRASAQAALILANLDQVASAINDGAIVVLQASRVRVRQLPVHTDS